MTLSKERRSKRCLSGATLVIRKLDSASHQTALKCCEGFYQGADGIRCLRTFYLMRLFSIAHISVGVEMMVYSEDGRDLRV